MAEATPQAVQAIVNAILGPNGVPIDQGDGTGSRNGGVGPGVPRGGVPQILPGGRLTTPTQGGLTTQPGQLPPGPTGGLLHINPDTGGYQPGDIRLQQPPPGGPGGPGGPPAPPPIQVHDLGARHYRNLPGAGGQAPGVRGPGGPTVGPGTVPGGGPGGVAPPGQPTGNPTFNPDGTPVTAFTYPKNPQAGTIPYGDGKVAGYQGPAFVDPGTDKSQANLEKANPAYYSWLKQTMSHLATPMERWFFAKNTHQNWQNTGLTSEEFNKMDYDQFYGHPEAEGIVSKMTPLINAANQFWG